MCYRPSWPGLYMDILWILQYLMRDTILYCTGMFIIVSVAWRLKQSRWLYSCKTPKRNHFSSIFTTLQVKSLVETLFLFTFLIQEFSIPPKSLFKSGHVNFSDEVSAAFRLCDGVVIFVDASEGARFVWPPECSISHQMQLSINALCGLSRVQVQPQTDRLMKLAVMNRLPMCLCINKLDRLIIELKLPPADAHFRIRQIIDECNTILTWGAPRIIILLHSPYLSPS